jgi:hypothetical protein
VDIPAFRLLLTCPGQEALQAAASLAPSEANFLGHFQALSRRFPPELARAALETAILRQAAAAKFPLAERMYFTREALEQASASTVSTYRAKRYHPFERLIDLGCSIGGDTLSLAVVAPTLGVDRDPLRLAMARANAHATGIAASAEFLQADLGVSLPLFLASHSLSFALFFDPARRVGGRRIFTVREYQPPLSIIDQWLPRCPALGIKLSPGVDLAELAGYDAEIEFISLNGELKEAVLWFGPLKSTGRRATILPGPYALTSPPHQTGVQSNHRLIREPQAYLYEPDPAVLRAGLVTTLAQQLDAAQLDPNIAYLTAAQSLPTPFARCWIIEGWFPFQIKRLRAYLRERGIGQVVVKKRGSPIEPEALIHDLRLTGDLECTIFLTHLRGRPIVIIGQPLKDR